LTLPNFTKTEDELDTLQDKWFYVFRHLHELDEIPPRLRERVFLSLFEKARIARFQPEERDAYESSLKYYRDLKNVIDTARDEGREEGRLDEKRNLAIRMIRREMSDEDIAELTGLSIAALAEIRANLAHFISDEPLKNRGQAH
ncbi:PD-(D/E)XK nuclease family transposase, partial [Alkalicoccus sp. WONF2802]